MKLLWPWSMAPPVKMWLESAMLTLCVPHTCIHAHIHSDHDLSMSVQNISSPGKKKAVKS